MGIATNWERFKKVVRFNSCTIILFGIFFLHSVKATTQNSPSGGRGTTYCNPINIDYGYSPIPNFSEWGRHRATADPVIVTFKGDYYLFSTNQWGYWWSKDMLNWNGSIPI